MVDKRGKLQKIRRRRLQDRISKKTASNEEESEPTETEQDEDLEKE